MPLCMMAVSKEKKPFTETREGESVAIIIGH
jgi:hypothetical protein